MLLELLIGFLKVGLFSFGGAYAAIPLITRVVEQYNWITREELIYMIAISESTPGPIMVNLATFIGYDKAGILGSIVATLASILPAFLIMLALVTIFKKWLENKYFKAVIKGLQPCVIGIILSAGLVMMYKNIFFSTAVRAVDPYAIAITITLAAMVILYKRKNKKELSPIAIIIFGAILGIIAYTFFALAGAK